MNELVKYIYGDTKRNVAQNIRGRTIDEARIFKTDASGQMTPLEQLPKAVVQLVKRGG